MKKNLYFANAVIVDCTVPESWNIYYVRRYGRNGEHLLKAFYDVDGSTFHSENEVFHYVKNASLRGKFISHPIVWWAESPFRD